MTDRISESKRSWNMSRIRSRNTTPEILVRRELHGLGYRFTVNSERNKKLPGKPDIILPKYQSVIFVHGCFWHQHSDCREGRIPSSNVAYWKSKLEKNIQRDLENQSKLKKDGWKVLVIWECQTREPGAVRSILSHFLQDQNDV